MPAGNIASKLFYKARAGLHDLWHETIKDYPASLTLSAGARTVVNGNCLRCHQSTVERVTMAPGAAISCTKCHRRSMHHKFRKMEERT
jgi:cytochrome c nitrite reductase small subunit